MKRGTPMSNSESRKRHTAENDAPVSHHRVGPGKCACGWDAYKVGWGFMDYGDLLYAHIRSEATTVIPPEVSAS